MKEISLSTPIETNSGENQLKLIRITEALLTQTLTETVATFQLLMRDGNLKPFLFDSAYRSELSCRSVMNRVNAMVELYAGDVAETLRISSYNLIQFFTSVTKQINMALGEKCKGDITFVEPEDFDSTVSFDARRICTILYHLVGNAIQHGRTENKNVEIHAEVMNGMFEMSVRDHGGGVQESKLKDLAKGELPPLDMESIDIKYFPPKFQNVGIPLCRKLTQDMGGELRLKNYKTGAKFIVTLPQKESRIREVSIYRPDDTLLKNCMADVLIALTE